MFEDSDFCTEEARHDFSLNIKSENKKQVLLGSSLETTQLTKFVNNNLPPRINTEDFTNKFNLYSHLAASAEGMCSPIFMDHCYARPWNWRPESNFLKPTKTLFIPKPIATKRKSANPLAPYQNCREIIDVEKESPELPPIYDVTRAKSLMEECERYVACARVDYENEDWEEKISRVNWTPLQNRVFNGMVNILNSDHLARLSYADVHNEPIYRRVVIDKSVKRVRHLMAMIAWDPKITQWIHQLLMDNLSSQYLAAYLDILQTLKYKLPTFVDKMMYGPSSSNRIGVLSNESLFPLLKRPWDPVAASLMQDKPKKLPSNPIIVVVPTAPTIYNSQFKRFHKWTTLLSNLATVVVIPMSIGSAGQRMTMMNCLDQMLAATRGKLQEIRNEHPGRHIILCGFNAGAALALQVAQSELVLCVLCLGFSLLTAEGKRGDPDDNLLELQCPVLFVIGQCSNTSLQEDLEDLRERMRVETGLIVVGSADDYLRVNKKKKRAEGITQSVVDRCIVDEVGDFVSGLILSPYPPQVRQSPTHIAPEVCHVKRLKTERKRHNSNGSSIDSEPPSPTTRITRPGQNNISPNFGRPPGSKAKAKLESKWASQMSQGIPIPTSPSTPSNSPPPVLTPVTPDTSSTDSFNTDKNPCHISPSIELSKKTLKCSSIHAEKFSKLSSSGFSSAKNVSTIPVSKFQAMNMANRSVITSGSALQNLFQGSYKQLPTVLQPRQNPSGIKVLENVSLGSIPNPKLLSISGRTVDLSKITLLNSVNQPKAGPAPGNVVLMPEGKIKTISPAIKNASGGIKYITSKKQLLTNKPPKSAKKVPYMHTANINTNLPPPTNLTSQDIMDLPIIFADDNQMITDNNFSHEIQQPLIHQNQTSKLMTNTSSGKFVFVNKQLPLPSSLTTTDLLNSTHLKRSLSSIPIKPNALKYTKIILSKKPTEDMKPTQSNTVPSLPILSSEISIRKVEQTSQKEMEPIDLEKELVATTVPKPNFGKFDFKNVTIIPKKSSDSNASIKTPQNSFKITSHELSTNEDENVPVLSDKDERQCL